MAEWELDRLTCPECGNPREECSDPDRPWYPYRRICYASMELAAAQDRYQSLHEKRAYHDGSFTRWSEKRTDEFPYQYDDGVHIGVDTEDRAPWDEFLTDVAASPLRPTVGDEVPSEDREADHGKDDA